MSRLDVRTGDKLTIIFINDEIETTQSKDLAQFTEHKEAVKNTVVYTM